MMRIKTDLRNAAYGLSPTLSQSERACCQYAATPGSKLLRSARGGLKVSHWYRSS